MRIRDWSSGVCSSDLISTPAWIVRPTLVDRLVPGTEGSWTARRSCPRVRGPPLPRRVVAASRHLRGQRDGCRRPPGQLPLLDQRVQRRRSEEHTSELQSLMRISYAVFCLKKKKKQIHKHKKINDTDEQTNRTLREDSV